MGPRSRGWRLLVSPTRRIAVLVGVGYVTAIAGVAVGLAGNPARPADRLTAAAIALLFVSFLAMFQASRTLVGMDPGK